MALRAVQQHLYHSKLLDKGNQGIILMIAEMRCIIEQPHLSFCQTQNSFFFFCEKEFGHTEPKGSADFLQGRNGWRQFFLIPGRYGRLRHPRLLSQFIFAPVPFPSQGTNPL